MQFLLHEMLGYIENSSQADITALYIRLWSRYL